MNNGFMLKIVVGNCENMRKNIQTELSFLLLLNLPAH